MALDEKYYSIDELINRGLGSKATIHRYFKSGKLTRLKFGKATRVAASEIERFLHQKNILPNQNGSN